MGADVGPKIPRQDKAMVKGRVSKHWVPYFSHLDREKNVSMNVICQTNTLTRNTLTTPGCNMGRSTMLHENNVFKVQNRLNFMNKTMKQKYNTT